MEPLQKRREGQEWARSVETKENLSGETVAPGPSPAKECQYKVEVEKRPWI